MTDTPDIEALVAELRALSRTHPVGCRDDIEVRSVCAEAADALERQQARIVLLEERNDQHNRTGARMARDNMALEAVVEAVAVALQFYADPETYHACLFMFDPPTGGFDGDFDEAHGGEYDRPMPGKLARETLAALKARNHATSRSLAGEGLLVP